MASPQRNSGLSPGHNWWGMLSRHREVVVSIAMIIGGCVLNNVVLELMVLQDSGCGNIITLAQFAFVAVEGLLQHLELDRMWPKVQAQQCFLTHACRIHIQLVSETPCDPFELLLPPCGHVLHSLRAQQHGLWVPHLPSPPHDLPQRFPRHEPPCRRSLLREKVWRSSSFSLSLTPKSADTPWVSTSQC